MKIVLDLTEEELSALIVLIGNSKDAPEHSAGWKLYNKIVDALNENWKK